MNSTLEWMTLCACLAATLHADPADTSPLERGRTIAETARNRHAGFGDSSARLRMTLRNRRGQTSERTLRLYALEQEGDRVLSLHLFDTPGDVRGTVLLTHARPGGGEQWIYLPAAGRVTRIAARSRNASFMGSEFAYEDLDDPVPADHTYTWLRDETWQGIPCHVIQREAPPGLHSGYSRQEIWLDQEHYLIRCATYYDRRGALLKTLTMNRYQLFQDRFWRAQEMRMENHQTGSITQLDWSDLEFNSGLTPAGFDPRRLPLLQ